MRFILSDEQITQLAYTAGGAATAPLMQDHPDYVFPDQRVAAGVEAAIADLKPGFESEDTPSLGVSEVQAYLDSAIRSWRGLRDGTAEPTPPLTAEEAKQKAPQYIDAYQSVRVSLLGRQLA